MTMINSINSSLGGLLKTQEAVTLTGVFPFTGNLTGSTNITFPTSGTLATTAQLSQWPPIPIVVTGSTQTLSPNNFYNIESSSIAVLTLPAIAAKGSIIRINGVGTGLWQIAQLAGQSIKHGFVSTTTGIVGTYNSKLQYDCIEMTCIVANTTWLVTMSQGNFEVL